MNYKIIFGLAASAISFISYIPYFRDIFLKRTRPHIFSWLAWSLIGGIVFFAQILEGSGPGAWVVGLGALLCLSISVLSFFMVKKR